MGIVRTNESQRMEIEEFRRMLLSCAGVRQKKDEDELRGSRRVMAGEHEYDLTDKLVCVTSGVSFLGISIVNQLLVRGYSVRVIIDNPEDVERLRELEVSGEIRESINPVEIIMANLTGTESLLAAFNGCRAVFHTAAFVDPAGLSGYSKSMADVEVEVSKNVIEACAAAPSVRHCVLTSSLLACIWQDKSREDLPQLIDHNSWSDESVCINKKLWYGLGKLRAEKAAWSVAQERGLKVATICPGLVTGPGFFRRNPTSTVAYLKGAREMFSDGLLATVNVNTLAKAHVLVLEEMQKTAFGRYTCFDQVIRNEEEIEKLVRETEINISYARENVSSISSSPFKLSNLKLSRLMSSIYSCHEN